MYRFVRKNCASIVAFQFSLLNNFVINSVFQMGFLLLKINLCISDLTLILMSVINFIWLLTYQWPGGDILCRLSQVIPLTERTTWLVRNSRKSKLFANIIGNRNAWIYILLKETQFKTFNIFPIFISEFLVLVNVLPVWLYEHHDLHRSRQTEKCAFGLENLFTQRRLF